MTVGMIDFGTGDYMARLNQRLKDAGVTRAALARKSQCAESQVARWFNSATRPSMENIVRLEMAFRALTTPAAEG